MMPMDGMPPGMFENEMIGAIKIKDGLFIGDELASTVSCLGFSFMLRTWNSWLQIRSRTLSTAQASRSKTTGSRSVWPT